MKKLFLTLAFVAFIVPAAYAADLVNTGFFGSTAIKGYDPVAYFTESKPVKGSDSFTFKWRDATWKFSNQENLDTFKANPDKYAPQYGGWCAFAMAKGKKVGIDPEAWAISDGKLYLNYSKSVNADWSKDKQNYIAKADAEWTKIKN